MKAIENKAARETKAPTRILLVDDDRTFCTALSSTLRRRKFQVLIAHNVAEAIAETRAWAPHKAVIDLRMPDGNGLSLVKYLKEEFPEIKSVVLTGYGSIATAVEAVKLGAVHYLTKPVSADELLTAFSGQPLDSIEREPPQAASLDVVEWEHLQRVLSECEGNISEAARRLKMHRRTLQRKLARGRDGNG